MTIRFEDTATMDFSDVAGPERIGTVTPGDVLRNDFMRLLGRSARALAREINVPSNRIAAETAILLGERFGASAEFWLNRQTMHDPEEARHRLRRAA